MAIQRCPRCDLNYVKPGMQYCKVCTRELDKSNNDLETKGICPICGIIPLKSNQDICDTCMNERKKMSGFLIEDENIEEPEEENDDMDGMVVLNIDDDIPQEKNEEYEKE